MIMKEAAQKPAPSAFEHCGFKIVPLKIRQSDGTV